MGKHLTLTTTDNHKLGAYRADPAGKPKGGIVVVQEIFGVNHHIRAVCDRLAALGYVAVAPAVFDRFVRGRDVHEPGSGLGLSIVKRIADAHHATVTLDAPAEGSGLVVRVRFPP